MQPNSQSSSILDVGDLKTKLRLLETCGVEALRRQYQSLFGRSSPSAFGPDLLRRRIAQHLQEKAFGGLSPRAQRLLYDLLKSNEKNPLGPIQLPRRIKAGSVLVREWKGKAHRVTILDDGFIYDGETYASLSEIARSITGTRWNGPRFFGLRSTLNDTITAREIHRAKCPAPSATAEVSL